MSAESLQTFVSLGGLILAVVGLPTLFIQIRELQRSVQSQVHAASYVQAAEFRAHLIAYPQLRKYFFDGAEIAPGHAEYDRTVTIAESYLNYLEHIAVMADSFGRRNRTALDRFCRNALAHGPILRRRLEENPAGYSDALLALRTQPLSAGE
jgi:hypothetical protein